MSAPLTICTRRKSFSWTKVAKIIFEHLKKKVIEASILSLLDFEKLFNIEYNALVVAIGGVLSQEGRPISFFIKKLNDAKKMYGNYDKEIYVIVETLKQ